MESFEIPIPLPSIIVTGQHGALRLTRQRLYEVIQSGNFESAKVVADEYNALFCKIVSERNGPRGAGSVWRFTGDPAICSFSIEFERTMIRDTRISLRVREAASSSHRDVRCELLAEALGMCRAERASSKALLIELLIHAEYIDAAHGSNASAWRAIHTRAMEGARMMHADRDVRGVRTANAIAADALARACEAAAEVKFSGAHFLEAAQLAAAGRSSFQDRAKQLAAVATDRNLVVGNRSALQLIDLLPPAASLPAL